MRVLYLYAEVMGYTMATIKLLAEIGVDVYVVYWDNMTLTPYRIPDYNRVIKYPRSEHSVDSLQMLARSVDPDITVVSGWMDKAYLSLAALLRKKGKSVVVGFDGQWNGTMKQHFAALLGLCGYFSSFFSHAWVAGVYQYEYARKLGFVKERIILDLLSADVALFENKYHNCYELKKVDYPHRFLFVGRFEDIKGLDVLVNAWEMVSKEKKDWELYLVGNGSLKEKLLATSEIVVKDFMQPEELVEEIVGAGCLVLPSRSEPWGVVVHEFAAAGLPLIVSDKVGSAVSFLIPGMNGYSFKANDAKSLAKSILDVIRSEDKMLFEMSNVSYQLSLRVTPATSAYNLLSVAKQAGSRSQQ